MPKNAADLRGAVALPVRLYLTYCRTRRVTVDGKPGRPEPRRPSRYLRGLPADLVERAA